MNLDLVHGRWDSTLFKNPLDFSLVEVAHPNRLHLARVNKLLHCLPRIDVVDLGRLHLSICVLWHELGAGFECHRPVHQEEIDVVGSQSCEGVVERWLNILWSVGIVPELGGDEEALAVYS